MTSLSGRPARVLRPYAEWQLFERHRIEKGGNYGWSLMEGPQVCLPDQKLGPTPILPPAHAIPHRPMAVSSVAGPKKL